MKAAIRVSRDDVISPIDERLYSSFVEHMGRAVYTGIYEPGHPSADGDGFREDVAELIRPLRLAHIRYPGGNFVSGYRWEDGVGPRESRPVRRDLAWMALEPNQVGTNEFMDFCRKVDAEPMLAVNLGTRDAQAAADLVEYCNVPGGTYLSDLRRSHGWEAPHGVKLWCLGNEMDGPWQICAKTAEEYGRLACETAKMMKWMDPSIELVACGSSNREMPTFGDWERTVLRHCGQYIDYLSLHQYYRCDDGDVPSLLARSGQMDGFIREVAAICREYQTETGREKPIGLSFDEWNVWYHWQNEGGDAPRWVVGRPIEEERYNFADALAVGGLLTTLINNADTVKIACLAQLVNVLAPISTQPGGRAWVQTTYAPFLLTSRCGRGTALRAEVDCPAYDCAAGRDVPYLDCAAVLAPAGDGLTLFVVNKSLTEEMVCTLDTPVRTGELTSLTAPALDSVNTPEGTCIRKTVTRTGPKGCVTLPPASWNMIRLPGRADGE